MADNKNINCPNCGHNIDVNDLLFHQVNDELKKQYNDELLKEKNKIEEQSLVLKKSQNELNLQKNSQQEEVDKRVADKLKQEKVSLNKSIKAELENEQSDAMNSLKEELNQKSSKIKELSLTSIELEKVKREKGELELNIRASAQKELTQKLYEEKEKIKKEEEEKNSLKLRELEKKLEDQMKLTEEMKRKQEQGSMQSQGEVQELAIEEWLASKFKLDTIREIKKGERGADCLQIIHTRTLQNCGTIYYESKRTKSFQQNWIEKFKNDIREKNANIGVLVTEVMPVGMERLGLKEGIWICTFEEFKSLCTVLRESIIKLSEALVTQENKGDKMGMLYDFLTSNEFRLQIESIVEGFTQMKSDLDTEQRAMRKIWSKREKQIEKVLINTTEMVGSIKGIAGNALGDIPLLELPYSDED
jgi:hypothetical protein